MATPAEKVSALVAEKTLKWATQVQEAKKKIVGMLSNPKAMPGWEFRVAEKIVDGSLVMTITVSADMVGGK